jgi:4-amino-4-deoxy-L-arabinose transferase-like glycosyltransferase
MFIFTLGVYLFYKFLKRNQPLLAFSLAGFVAALQFLTKGFPALYHIPVSVLTVLFFENSLRLLFTPYPLAGFLSFFIPLAIWYLNLHNPEAYLKGLWSESFRRIEETDRVVKTVKHLLTYPLLTFKQLLPYSAVLLFVFLFKKERNSFGKGIFDKNVKVLLTLFFVNYLPYLISPAGKGRYALIAFPFVALLFARFLADTLTEKRIKTFLLGVIPLVLFTLAVIPILLYPSFFVENNDPVQLLFLIPLLVTILYAISQTRKEGLDLLTFLVLITLTVKVGFANFAAVQKTRANPAREIALALAPAIPPDTEIKYLPQKIYMELCAYTDAFTRSIVLRKTDSPIVLTDKKDLPRGCKVERENRGWVIAVCGLPKGNNQSFSIAQ